MTMVTVSPKYQIVIPKNVRDELGIKAGQKVQIITYQGRIELIPLQPMRDLKGFLSGLDTTLERDPDRL